MLAADKVRCSTHSHSPGYVHGNPLLSCAVGSWLGIVLFILLLLVVRCVLLLIVGVCLLLVLCILVVSGGAVGGALRRAVSTRGGACDTPTLLHQSNCYDRESTLVKIILQI